MNYYNEFDQNAAAWLRELISNGLIPAGDVDERSIEDVRADDIRGYTQCHFFAGIGGWSLALQLAGWPEDKPVWTGSCPCQPFSVAGKQLGTSDDRDLWPAFFRLIEKCQPEFVFGEQVANAVRHNWIDRICADLEGENYTVGSVILGAHSVGSPHKRQRLYWGGVCMAEKSDGRRFGRRADGDTNWDDGQIQTQRLGNGIGMADSCGAERNGSQAYGSDSTSGLPGFSPWDNSAFILCRDWKARRIPAESLLFGLVDGVSESMDGGRVTGVSEIEGFPLTKETEGRVMLLKGYGNAIVPQVAAEFVRSFIDAKHDCFGE